MIVPIHGLLVIRKNYPDINIDSVTLLGICEEAYEKWNSKGGSSLEQEILKTLHTYMRKINMGDAEGTDQEIIESIEGSYIQDENFLIKMEEFFEGLNTDDKQIFESLVDENITNRKLAKIFDTSVSTIKRRKKILREDLFNYLREG